MSDELEVCIEEIKKIITESHNYYYRLLSLSISTPRVFIKGSASNNSDVAKLQSVMLGFSYFDKMSKNETKLVKSLSLDSMRELLGTDQLLWIQSIGELFDQVSFLPTKINYFLNELKLNHYFGVTFSSLLNSSDSCSCISEMISMLGKLLLLLDVLFPGDMREKIIVAYFRLFIMEQSKEIPATTKNIMKNTDFTSKQSFPKKYPYDYFNRCNIEESNIIDLIDSINRHDLYNQMKYFSVDENKDYLAFHYQANQAIILSFFCSSFRTSDKQNSSLLSIINKTYDHFQRVELAPSLAFSFKTLFSNSVSATAINQICPSDSFNSYLDSNYKKVRANIEKTDSYIKGKSLDFHLVLTNREDIYSLIRDNNYLIQWFTVHCQDPRILNSTSINDIIELLLKSSFLEELTEQAIQYILKNKKEIWSYYHYLLTAHFENYMTDEIREILDNLLSFSEQSNRLNECYKMLRYLKEKLTTSFVGKSSACHVVIGNMMRFALLMKDNSEEEFKSISVFTSGFLFVTAYQAQINSFLHKQQDQLLCFLPSFIHKLELSYSHNPYLDSATYTTFLEAMINSFTYSLPTTVAEIYKDLIDCLEESLSCLPKLPYEIKNELHLYSSSQERERISSSLAQIAHVADEMKKFDSILAKHHYHTLQPSIQQEFIQNCIQTLSSILSSSFSIQQSSFVQSTPSMSSLFTTATTIGRKLSLFHQTLKLLESILHFDSEKLFKEEYSHMINFTLFEEIKLLTNNIAKVNPFKHPVFPTIYEVPTTKKPSFIGYFISTCLSLLLSSDYWYSENTCGWESQKEVIVLGIDQTMLLLNNLGIEMMIAFDQYMKIQISLLLNSVNKQVQNQLSVVSYLNLDYTSSSFSHNVRSLILQYSSETIVNTKLLTKLGCLLLLRFLFQKTIYFYHRKVDIEELSNSESQAKHLTNTLHSLNHPMEYEQIGTVLSQNQLPSLSSLAEFAEKLRVSGLTQPVEEVYLHNTCLPELPYALFVVCVYASQESIFIRMSHTIFGSSPDKGHIDGVPLAMSIVSCLTQYDISLSKIFMELARCYFRGEVCRNVEKKSFQNLNQIARLRWLILKIASLSSYIREGCASIILDIENMKFGDSCTLLL